MDGALMWMIRRRNIVFTKCGTGIMRKLPGMSMWKGWGFIISQKYF